MLRVSRPGWNLVAGELVSSGFHVYYKKIYSARLQVQKCEILLKAEKIEATAMRSLKRQSKPGERGEQRGIYRSYQTTPPAPRNSAWL